MLKQNSFVIRIKIQGGLGKLITLPHQVSARTKCMKSLFHQVGLLPLQEGGAGALLKMALKQLSLKTPCTMVPMEMVPHQSKDSFQKCREWFRGPGGHM